MLSRSGLIPAFVSSPSPFPIPGVELSNTPFRGTVGAAGGGWKEIELGVTKPEADALPFVALNAFGARVFQRQAR